MDNAKLNELADWLLSTTKAAEAFVIEQAPDVARQIIAWGTAQAWAGVVVAVLLGLLSAALLFKASREDDLYDCPFLVGGIASGILAVIVACVNVTTLIQIHTAPKLYLLKAAARLL